MRGVLTQIRTAVLRRRAQTATVLMISLLAGSVSTMALTLLVRSTQPWDDAFNAAAGAHLMFHFDVAKVSREQLQATASLPGVTAAGPPHQTLVVPFKRGSQKGDLQLIGRSDPGGGIDRIPIAAGRWPQHPGEIAVTRTHDSSIPIQPRLGETILALTGQGTVPFMVVGEAIELGGHALVIDFSNAAAGAWVLPSDLTRLAVGRQPQLHYEMAYRFQHAATSDQLAADRREVEAALPAGSETQPVEDWQLMREGSIWFIVLLSSIIVSFTVFALLAVTVIVGSVVAGSVLSSYRDIGIAKALGFTPAQVVAIYIGQMLAPALIGALFGVPLGSLASRPILDDAANSVQLPEPAFFDPVVAAAVPSALAVLVALAALAPALRAAATDSVRAMVLGTAPPVARRSWIATSLARLRAPRSLSIGAGDAFSRPVRGLLTTVAFTIGIATATFAIGFQNSLSQMVKDPSAYGYAQDVVVHRYPAISDATVTAELARQPETRVVVGVQRFTVRIAAAKDPAALYAMRGDTSALGYRAARGRWFAAPGEAVIGPGLSKAANVRIGDSLSASLVGGPSLPLRVVGFYNDFNTSGLSIAIGRDTLAAAVADAVPDEYRVKLRAGADAKAYAKRIEALSPDYLQAQATSFADTSAYVNLIKGMITVLAAVLMGIAAVGVFNAARLTARERVRDIAILKAVGMTSAQIGLMAVGATLVLAVAAAIAGLPLGLWLEQQIWEGIADFSGVLIRTYGLEPLSLGLALVAAFVLALLGTALPARWAAATPVAQVLRSE